MAKRLYRCLVCTREFEADKPACEACGIDPATDPRNKDVIVPLVTHHFDPPSKVPGRGLGHAACNPRLRIGTPKCAFTGEPESVNCAACKASAQFLAADGLSAGAVEIPLTPKGG